MKTDYIKWILLGMQFACLVFSLYICVKSRKLHKKLTRKYQEMEMQEFVNSEN